jgi:hypothetical protein
MPYLNIDDNFADHPKIDGLSDGAFRLHVAAMCYAAKHLTDGAIPAARVPRLAPRFKTTYTQELIKAGVWIDHDGDYRIHDFLQWNKPRSWWQKERSDAADRQRKHREKKELEKREAAARDAKLEREARERWIEEGVDPDTGEPL